MANPEEALVLVVTKIDKRGREIAPLTHRVKSFDYEDGEKGVDEGTLVFDNAELKNWKLDGNHDIGFGDFVRITFGDGNGTRTLVMRVCGVRGEDELQVSVKNKSESTNWRKRSRVWKNKSRSQIVKDIAQEHGLEISDIEDSGSPVASTMQMRMSDAQFMNYLAWLEGFQLSITQRGLRFASRNYGKRPVKTYTYHYGDTNDILDFELDTDVTKIPAKIRSVSLNRMKKKPEVSEADNSTEQDRDVLTNFTGSITTDSMEDGGEFIVATEEIKTSSEDAPKDAKARFKRAEQRSIKLNIQIVGDARILPTMIVRVDGINPAISGLYYIKKVRYSVSADGGFTQWLDMRTTGLNKGGNRPTGDRRSVFEQCRNALAAVTATDVNPPSPASQELVAFILFLERVASSGKRPTDQQVTKSIQRAAYLQTNLAAVSDTLGAGAVAECQALLETLQSEADKPEGTTGKVNELDPRSEEDLHPNLTVENQGPVSGTLQGTEAVIESLGPVNDQVRIEYIEDPQGGQRDG